MNFISLVLIIILVSFATNGYSIAKNIDKCLKGDTVVVLTKEFTCQRTEKQLKLDELDKQRKELLK